MSWDLGLDYEPAEKTIAARLRELRGKRGVRARRSVAYFAVLLTQLRNGSRVSEALDAVVAWAATRRREVEVSVRKHRISEMRKMVIPEELSEEDHLDCASVVGAIKPSTAKMYAKRNLGINTHSLRYARITHLAKKGLSPSLIAKITHHCRLDYVLRYT